MHELVVVSGKGGTGKTSLMGAFAALSHNKIMVDCDVDAADLHLILNNQLRQSHDFIASYKASIIEEKCTACGICPDYCRFEAIKQNGGGFRIDQLACEGCGVCTHFCPEEAIEFKQIKSGEWYLSDTNFGPLVHARLGIAQSNSGRLVTWLRQTARDLAARNGFDLIIVDGPPGIGCPVIASITGAGFVLVVTEPSLSAFHDMERILDLCGHFNIPAGICINKYDINLSISDRIRKFAHEKHIILLGEIGFDPEVTRAQVAGKTCIEHIQNETTDKIKTIWQKVEKELIKTGK